VNYHTEQFYRNLGLGFAIGILASSVLTLILSHRLAGPIVRLKKFFEALGQKGDSPSTLQFRKMDFFSDLPPVINHSLEELQKRKSKG
jgi:hypothetical protein